MNVLNDTVNHDSIRKIIARIGVDGDFGHCHDEKIEESTETFAKRFRAK